MVDMEKKIYYLINDMLEEIKYAERYVETGEVCEDLDNKKKYCEMAVDELKHFSTLKCILEKKITANSMELKMDNILVQAFWSNMCRWSEAVEDKVEDFQDSLK